MTGAYGYLLAAWLILANLAAYVMFWLDKQYARKNLWRISEKDLMLSAVLGGGIGALMGMYRFRHKTRHLKFTVGIPVIILIQVIFLFLNLSHNLT